MKAQQHLSNQFSFSDDGFVATAAEPWFKVKVQVIQHYFQSFIENVHSRVDDIVFIDLYAGSGVYSFGHQRDAFLATSLASLKTDLPVSKWIFCESELENSKALKIRVNKNFRGKNVVILEGKPEDLLEKLQYYTPQSKGSYKVATFCVVDPFSFEVPFSTMDKLAHLGCSFLNPFTFSLNNRIDYKFYLKNQRERLIKFLGGESHYEKLSSVSNNQEFCKRLVKIYQNNMLMLGLNTALSVHKVDSGLMEIPMYYMGFFSKQFPTKVIQRDVLTKEHLQFQLF